MFLFLILPTSFLLCWYVIYVHFVLSTVGNNKYNATILVKQAFLQIALIPVSLSLSCSLCLSLYLSLSHSHILSSRFEKYSRSLPTIQILYPKCRYDNENHTQITPQNKNNIFRMLFTVQYCIVSSWYAYA